jgi:glycosyltransferase involved in cell wall biosynthesis
MAPAGETIGVGPGSRDSMPGRALRILHVIDSAGVYGAERVLLSLAAESARRGHEVFVATVVSPLDKGDPLGDAAVGSGLHHVRFLMRDGPNVSGLRRILHFARDRSIDVIHSHGYRANILFACVPRRGHRWVLICTLHGWTSGGRLEKLRLYEVLERRLIRRFDHVVAVSSKIADQVRCRSLGERLSTIANGVASVDHASPRDPPRIESPLGSGHPDLLAVGRLGVEKGFDLLIAAMCILRERGVAARLKIAGEGPERPKLEAQIAAHSLDGIVELLGYQAVVSPLYRAADFFVLSSRTEGLPVVLLEAMAHGTPVIASAVGEVSEVLEGGRCGWLIRHLDAGAIAQTLSEAMAADPGERATRMRRARERVHAAYSVTTMTDRYLAVYLQAVDGLPDFRATGKLKLQ